MPVHMLSDGLAALVVDKVDAIEASGASVRRWMGVLDALPSCWGLPCHIAVSGEGADSAHEFRLGGPTELLSQTW